VLSGGGLCGELITRPEESYRMCCVVVCDLETSRIGALYIYDISNLRVNVILHFGPRNFEWVFDYSFFNKISRNVFVSSMRFTCPTYPVFITLVFLKLFCEMCTSWKIHCALFFSILYFPFVRCIHSLPHSILQ
jgi:hypothetical protein